MKSVTTNAWQKLEGERRSTLECRIGSSFRCVRCATGRASRQTRLRTLLVFLGTASAWPEPTPEQTRALARLLLPTSVSFARVTSNLAKRRSCCGERRCTDCAGSRYGMRRKGGGYAHTDYFAKENEQKETVRAADAADVCPVCKKAIENRSESTVVAGKPWHRACYMEFSSK